VALETRCYLVIDAAGYRTSEQWHTLISGLKAKPMSAAIIDAARGDSHNTVNINRFSVPNVAGNSWYMLGDFEIRGEDRDELLAVLDAQAAIHEIEGFGTRETFRRVLLEEIKEVAIEAGFPSLAPLLGLEIIGFGQREVAIIDARRWIFARSEIWEPDPED
jgi:hypothetical protein